TNGTERHIPPGARTRTAVRRTSIRPGCCGTARGSAVAPGVGPGAGPVGATGTGVRSRGDSLAPWQAFLITVDCSSLWRAALGRSAPTSSRGRGVCRSIFGGGWDAFASFASFRVRSPDPTPRNAANANASVTPAPATIGRGTPPNQRPAQVALA